MSNQPAISKEEVLRKSMIELFEDEAKEKFPEDEWARSIYLDGADDAIEQFTMQTAALREENERLKAENAELREALKSFNKDIADAITDRENQLNSLTPLGRHALSGPIKAQIAILNDLQQSILSKHKP